jgi:hypothetical protein
MKIHLVLALIYGTCMTAGLACGWLHGTEVNKLANSLLLLTLAAAMMGSLAWQLVSWRFGAASVAVSLYSIVGPLCIGVASTVWLWLMLTRGSATHGQQHNAELGLCYVAIAAYLPAWVLLTWHINAYASTRTCVK